MTRYALKRFAGMIPLVLLISLVCFALMHAIPGGPVGALGENPRSGAAERAQARANFGLDEPLPVQYGKWLGRVVLHGDFGRSYVTGEPVLQMIGDRLPATLLLMISAFVLSLFAGIGLGALAAVKRHTPVDSFVTIASLVVISIPMFWSGLMLMMLFSVKWQLLPSAGLQTIGAEFSAIDRLRHLVMPTLVLSSILVASWSRYVRESLVDALEQPHVAVAKAKGLHQSAVLLRHVMRNALAPVVTVVALNLPLLFTGAVIVETLFAWPGMGRLFYDGLLQLDYSRLMGIVVISSFFIAVFNLLADLTYGVLDPRIRYGR